MTNIAGPRHGRGAWFRCIARGCAGSYDGHEVELPSWTAAQAEDWLGRWAMNLMLINVSTLLKSRTRLTIRFHLPRASLPIQCTGRAT